MSLQRITGIPTLKVAREIKAVEFFDPKKAHIFHYESKEHKNWPHVVKFSGGKTSGMLLFMLLKAGALKPKRGDVVVFNNTSAEHPNTYAFAKQCKRIVEQQYGVPFFWVEHQTYEDARSGEYVRLSAFRLVNDRPYSESNPHGYHHRGEVFEELLSHKGYVPTVFQRTCTKAMKLEATRLFLREWLANKDATERLGHFGVESRLDEDDMHDLHRSNQGGVPKTIFTDKKRFVKSRPFVRSAQAWTDYSTAVKPITNEHLKGKVFGRNADFGEGGIQYVSFVGIRHDEMQRVVKIQRRNEGGPDAADYEGEHVYMPLAGIGINEQDVHAFWNKQTWGLDLNPDDNLSNCVFCFLKGAQKLQQAKNALVHAAEGDLANTPCDIRWWVDIEKKYGRDLIAEERDIKSPVPGDFIGFFGASSELTYEKIMQAESANQLCALSERGLPCDCTD